jgi:hypothetical protein
VARTNSGLLTLAKGNYARGAIKGFPDIICLYKGRMYGIEVKSSTGKQSPDQIRMQMWFSQCGGIYLVVRTLDEIKEIIQ